MRARGRVGVRVPVGAAVGVVVGVFRCGCVWASASVAVGTGVGASRRGSGLGRVGACVSEVPSFFFEKKKVHSFCKALVFRSLTLLKQKNKNSARNFGKLTFKTFKPLHFFSFEKKNKKKKKKKGKTSTTHTHAPAPTHAATPKGLCRFVFFRSGNALPEEGAVEGAQA